MRTLFIAIALVLSVDGVAHAAELFSPWLFAGSSAQIFQCRIVNISAVAQIVRIRVYDSTGGLVADVAETSVPPRGATGAALPNSAAAAYCRFTTSGTKGLFRASVEVYDSVNSRTLVALPAQ